MEKVLDHKKIDSIDVFSFHENNRLNVSIAEHVKNEITAYITSSDSKIILDFSGVNFIDSTGFGILVKIFNTAKDNGAVFKLCNVSKELMELVEITKLDDVFTICKTLISCLESFK